MTQTSPSIAQPLPTGRAAVSNGSRLLPGVDGRSASARRYRDLMKEFTGELGGEGIMTEPMRALVRQAAAVTVEAEKMQAAIVRGDPVDTEQLVRVTNTLARLMNLLKTKAKAAKAGQRTELSEYLRNRAAIA
ncbi:hypothetical protein SAMN02745157_2524 [Kaistia soli DSM 19436]|uniref:Uncharacterized protein n=2 Tax=Kaistia TaxID=166953 RepID=A0A1M5D0Y5_9HYPH|nr:hypothetical protein SAMN02745157_2524 [Kaistia soli DSM 19436]